MNWNRLHLVHWFCGPRILCWATALLLVVAAACAPAAPVVETHDITSPDGSIQVTFLLEGAEDSLAEPLSSRRKKGDLNDLD